jgi:predicted helicase
MGRGKNGPWENGPWENGPGESGPGESGPKTLPIQVIIGNPPYSVGQRSANDNARNRAYPALDKRIGLTYAAKSAAVNKNSLYDSYVRAFRWASDRLGQGGGIIGFVSNGGWLSGNAMDGMRECLAEEFSEIYAFDLRGNCRTSGELRQREAGNVFGPGTRTPIAVTVLVKAPGHKGRARIRYHDIGDYLGRERKLAIVSETGDVFGAGLAWQEIEPNGAGDWLDQRNDSFMAFTALGDKKGQGAGTFFKPCFSNGLKTNRDSWCYNFSVPKLRHNIKKSIDFYNGQVRRLDQLKLAPKEGGVSKEVDLSGEFDLDSSKFSWDYQQKIDAAKSRQYKYREESIFEGLYRPFSKQNVYFNKNLNNRVYLLPGLFPTKDHENLIICVSGIGATREFSALIAKAVPDVQLQFNGQCFPRYHYERADGDRLGLGGDNDGYVRQDAITDHVYLECLKKYGREVTKDDIFYYVYGLLHSGDYRREFSADLKKTLPRLPLVNRPGDFLAFSRAGRDLADLHLNYESAKPYGEVRIEGEEKGDFGVEKIRFVSKNDKSIICFNRAITIFGIPLAAYGYVVNGRSPIEWVMERYQVKTDPASGLKNDPNDWGRERGRPRYVLDLLLSLIAVSLETVKIVGQLPKLSL